MPPSTTNLEYTSGFAELLLRAALARHHAARVARTVRVAYDPVHGYGLLAARDIAAGELVIKYARPRVSNMLYESVEQV